MNPRFRVSNNSTAYISCESTSCSLSDLYSRLYAYLYSSNKTNQPKRNAVASNIKYTFRAINQKISLLDLVTQDDLSPKIKDQAEELLSELSKTNDPNEKSKIMNKIDNFFERINSGEII